MSALRLPGFRWRFGLLFGVGLAALSAMAEAQEVTLSAQGASGDLVDRLRGTSLLLRPSEDGTARSGQDIVAAARSDYGRLIGVLYEAGYFAPIINIRLDGRDAARLSPFSAPARVDRIQIDIATGAPFRLGQAQIAPLAGNTELPEGFRPGGAASTPLLRETTEAGLDGWRNQGHALADVGSQRITARNREAVLNVDVTLDPGPVVTFGNLLPQGHERMRPERIIAIAGLPTGEIYSPAALERVEERLRDTGVFSAVSLETQPLRAGDVMDYAAIIDEAPLRRLGFGVELSSSDGSAVSTYWLHRNLLGGGERLRFDASVAGIGTGDGRPDIELGARLDRPATFTADTTLNLTLDGAWLDEPLYELASIAAGIGVEHWISRTTTARAGITITQSEIDDALGNRSVTLATLPIGVTYDNRDNPLDARAGAFGELELAPFLAFGGEGGARMTLDARAYRGFGASDRTRLAGRFQLGTITGADITDIPPDALFYSGGSGTVRGQDFQALGALQNGVASGGRSFLGLSGELRHDIGDTDFGVVGFADFGLITTDDFGGGASDYHAGAGFGLRYDTPFGPIRIDLGTPASDGRFGQELFLYIGIGQAF